jgi:NAD(P)-dependent dehydrogenase (short-subunit alcohol dehydrogenase family)
MGEGIARCLAAEGAAVVISGRRKDCCERVADAIIQSGGKAIFTRADVSCESDCVKLIRMAEEHFGRLDILINNAAITPNEPAVDVPADMWDEVFAVNVRGAFICSREAIPLMRKVGGGSIINIGSTLAYNGSANRLAYSCSKAALLTMTKALARTCLGDQIRVNWVTVGWVATPGEIELRNQTHNNGKAYLDEVSRKALMGRLETVEEIAAGVLYLVSDDACHVVGCELNISGGLRI